MAQRQIDQTISASDTTSSVVSGAKILEDAEIHATLQIVPADSANFELVLQGAVSAFRSSVFAEIGRYSQADLPGPGAPYITTLPVSRNVLYRFLHISGASVRVMLTG